MELPLALRNAIGRALSGVAMNELAASAATLSARYRERAAGRTPNIATRADALAYVAARLPATYTAARVALEAVADAYPAFAPRALLDAGAGPGTAFWAAADCWPTIQRATLLEGSSLFAELGQQLADGAGLPDAVWRRTDLANPDGDYPRCDLVTAAYVLNELSAAAAARAADDLWRSTAQVLIIVEPGTPAGWGRIRDIREQLIGAGGRVVAPCPHDLNCPLKSPDWCHFAARVARSRQHRLAKGAELSWEDEKFSYVAIAREPVTKTWSRVIARPRKGSGHLTLKLCRPDGAATEQVYSRRDGEIFKRARRSDWGSAL